MVFDTVLRNGRIAGLEDEAVDIGLRGLTKAAALDHLEHVPRVPVSAVHRLVEALAADGMTEAFPIAYKSVSDEGVPGTSGRVNDAFDVRIIDADGNPLPAGEVGEITCRARTTHAMSEGYVSTVSVGAAGEPSLTVDPHDRVDTLTVAQRHMLEIAKAFAVSI